MALKSSGARAQKRNKTKSLFKFKSRGHTGVIIRCRGRRLFKVENTYTHTHTYTYTHPISKLNYHAFPRVDEYKDHGYIITDDISDDTAII